jgi:putative transposase
MIVQKAYKYRFFPTDSQKTQLAQTFGCARFVWNLGLELRSKTYQETQQSLSYAQTTEALTQWKKESGKVFLNDVSSVVLQQSLRNLDAAFNNFFEKRAAYPRFKSRKDKQSVRYQTNAFTYKEGKVTLAKQDEPLEISWSRLLPDDAKLISATVSKDQAERYFISILVATDIQPLPETNADVGIDVGIKTLATCSNGNNLENPRPLHKATKRLRLKQRRLSRKVKGSNNRHKQRIKVAKQHAKIRDIRADNIHQFTTVTIRENQAVYVEGLNVAGMLKNHRLAKHISDASFGEIFRRLSTRLCGTGGSSSPWINSFRPPNCVVTAVICCSSCLCLFVSGLVPNATANTTETETHRQSYCEQGEPCELPGRTPGK